MQGAPGALECMHDKSAALIWAILGRRAGWVKGEGLLLHSKSSAWYLGKWRPWCWITIIIRDMLVGSRATRMGRGMRPTAR